MIGPAVTAPSARPSHKEPRGSGSDGNEDAADPRGTTSDRRDGGWQDSGHEEPPWQPMWRPACAFLPAGRAIREETGEQQATIGRTVSDPADRTGRCRSWDARKMRTEWYGMQALDVPRRNGMRRHLPKVSSPSGPSRPQSGDRVKVLNSAPFPAIPAAPDRVDMKPLHCSNPNTDSGNVFPCQRGFCEPTASLRSFP